MSSTSSVDLLNWLRRLHVMAVKEFLQLLRDAVLLIFIAYAFTADIYLAGAGVSMQLREAALVIMDHDKSASSRELLSRFIPPNFRITEESFYPRHAMDQGAAMAVIDIGPSFEKSLISQEPATVQIQIDTTNSVLGFLASSYAQQIIGKYGLEIARNKLGAARGSVATGPVILDDHRVWFNPNQNDAWFMSISELLTIITLFSVLLPGGGHGARKGTRHGRAASGCTTFRFSDHVPQGARHDHGYSDRLRHQPQRGHRRHFSRADQGQPDALLCCDGALCVHNSRIGAFHLHHCQKSGPGRHDDGSGVYPHALSVRRVDPAGGHAHLDANGHVRFPASLLYRHGIRHSS